MTAVFVWTISDAISVALLAIIFLWAIGWCLWTLLEEMVKWWRNGKGRE